MVLISSEIDHNPQPEDVGTIRVSVNINNIYQSSDLLEEDIHEEVIIYTSRYPISSIGPLCVELTEILSESRNIAARDVCHVLTHCVQLVYDTTSSADYSSHCALRVVTTFTVFLPHDEEFSAYVFNILEEFEDDAVRSSLDRTNTIRSRPASKLVVGSLSRKIYSKTSDIVGEIDMCTICLDEFKDGTRIVTLPCGHEFDDECVVKWLEISHVCPMCRFQLPCED